jgi:hypothetical protein
MEGVRFDEYLLIFVISIEKIPGITFPLAGGPICIDGKARPTERNAWVHQRTTEKI